jgi:hypothetical protein
MTADQAGESPDADVADWTLFADRHHGRILIFAKRDDHGYDYTTCSDETPAPTDPSEFDSDEPSQAEISLRVWRNNLGHLTVAEATIANYSDERNEQSRLLAQAASEVFHALFEGDAFLNGPPRLWGDVPEELGGFLVYRTGAPRTRMQRRVAAEKSLAEAVDRARRNSTRRRRAR